MEKKRYAIIREATEEEMGSNRADIIEYQDKFYIINSIGGNRKRLQKLAVICDECCLAEIEENKTIIKQLLKIC